MRQNHIVDIGPATTVWEPGTAPQPPKAWVGRGIRPTKLRRESGQEAVSVKVLAHGVKAPVPSSAGAFPRCACVRRAAIIFAFCAH
ncbi:MAG: putative transposase for insertion sequence element, partial [Polaromonas sp.]|nr:putative transposase for insertion sequence element [Polaromonas sp.]